ncbi:type III polyketide synthase [Lacipirellula sp.]|uniref:type III polyketide synthase n=1 Tax=Lacipirellula sp. TaxID=2691419 RepID=UPI003D13AC52
MDIELRSVGVAVPAHEITQAASLALTERICCIDSRQRRFAKVLYEHAGVATRFGVLPLEEADRWAPNGSLTTDGSPNLGPSTEARMEYYQQHALPLAVEACRQALDRSGCQPSAITHLVTASCTGFSAPGVDLGLILHLRLPPTTERIHVGYMGCHGAINAIRAARGLACADVRNCILVCSVELCTIHYAFQWSNERMLGNALFADGSGAVVLRARETATDHPNSLWRLAATGSYIFPDTADAMTWSIGNHGFVMSISSELPRLIQTNLREWLSVWLQSYGLGVSDVSLWAVHPGGPRIVEAVEEAMGLSREQTAISRQVLSTYGNMSSATVLFILKSLLDSGARPPCVMLGFGPGLVAEAALFV